MFGEQSYACALCGGGITTADDLITVNVDGHGKAAHRVCPDESGRVLTPDPSERARCNRTVPHPPHPANIVGQEDRWLCPGIESGRVPSAEVDELQHRIQRTVEYVADVAALSSDPTLLVVLDAVVASLTRPARGSSS